MANELRPRQIAFAQKLISGMPVSRACEELGLSSQTAYHWMRDKNFSKYIRHLQDQISLQIVGSLSQAMTEAIEKLRNLIHCEKPTISLKACQTILESYQNIKEIKELTEKIEELEERLND